MEHLHVDKPVYPILSLIISMLIFLFGLFIAKEITIIYFLGALTVVFIIYGYGKVLRKAMPMFIVIGAIVGAGAMISSGNIMVGIQTLGRIMLLAYSSVIMVALAPIKLARNLVQLGAPRVLTLGMLATIRFIPILIGEIKQIREAMKSRGIHLKITDMSMLYRAFIIPFLMRLISISDIMAVSMETRGFSLKDKCTIVYERVEFSIRDAIFALLILSIILGVILV